MLVLIIRRTWVKERPLHLSTAMPEEGILIKAVLLTIKMTKFMVLMNHRNGINKMVSSPQLFSRNIR